MAEYWDLLDENRLPVGKRHLRGETIPSGLYHLVVHSWVMDENGLFLISRRQAGRTDECLWERTGGSVLAEETSLQGAVREVMEELGVDVSNSKSFLVKSVKREDRHDFFDAWLFIVKNSDVCCKMDEKEVMDWKWATREEMDNLKKQHLLVDSSEYYDEVYSFYKRVSELIENH